MIGLILCKTRNRIIAEYALRDMIKPIGVAEWTTRLVESLPEISKGAYRQWRNWRRHWRE